MTDQEVWDTLVRVMRETFDDEALQVNRETSAAHVSEWDSLTNIELLVNIQTTFGVKFNTGEIASLKNVGELVDVLIARLRKSGA